MRHIVIGDIHGMLNELVLLWSNLGIQKSDQVILLGDMIHKGPKSDAVIYFLRDKISQGYAVKAILGNHEVKHLKDVSKGKSVWVSLHPSSDSYLRGLKPYLRFENGGKSFVCVHAGLPPEMFLNDSDSRMFQEAEPLCWSTRYLGEYFWPELYSGQLGVALFGHQPYFEGPAVYYDFQGSPVAYGLDTGACMGYSLTAAVIEGGRVLFKSQPSLDSYTKRKLVPRDPNLSKAYLTSRENINKIWEKF